MCKLLTAIVIVTSVSGTIVPLPDLRQQIPASRSSQEKPGATRACSILSKEEVKKLAGSQDRFFDMVAPREESLPGGGSACAYSGITIQVDPFSPSTLEANRKKNGANWETVTDVGDTAYLFDNKPGASLHYAELYATVRGRVFTIQMSVRPADASVDTVRPSLLALARAIAAKLQ